MKNKASDIPKNVKIAKKVIRRKNGSSQMMQFHGTDLQSGIVTGDYLSKLHEMQVRYKKSEKNIEQLRKQLSKSDSLHTRFFSIIAHDLRSPFQVILGSLELIKMRLTGQNDDDLNDYIDMASESAVRTLKLLDDLLHWTISQKTDKSINTAKLNLYELVEHEIIFQNYSAKQKDVSISHSIKPELNVSGDLQMVKTILRNLMDNAIKYSNPGGDVSISAHENSRFVQIAVSDTGIGMSYDEQKRLFNIDSLHSTSGTKNEYGCGFGLILCKELIEMHGGELNVESLQGKGSKFMFTLPHYI